MKTIYLIKMGRDIAPNEHTEARNHRIRFCAKTKDVKYTVEFITTIPLDKKGFFRLSIDGTFQKISKDYEPSHHLNIENLGLKLEKAGSYYYKYTYDNILKVINKLLDDDYDTIELLKCSYIINFDFETFDSAKLELNKEMYNKAKEFEKLALQKIDEIKVGCRYNNSTCYYKGKDFVVMVHYNCYNDINYFNLEDYDKALEQLNNYTMPIENIQNAIKEHGLNPKRLY